MAKDGTNRGGARQGAGRKRKALADKIKDGDVKLNEAMLVSYTKLTGVEMPPVSTYMKAQQKDGKKLLAEQIYKETWEWLASYGCEKLVMKRIVEQFAMVCARAIHCEQAITEYGYLSKKGTGAVAVSPYVTMLNEFRRQASSIYGQMYQIVRENSALDVSNLTSSLDPMEQLLKF